MDNAGPVICVIEEAVQNMRQTAGDLCRLQADGSVRGATLSNEADRLTKSANKLEKLIK